MIRYLVLFIFFSSCSYFTVDPHVIQKLHQYKLIGWWTDGEGSYVKIFCEGQFKYERNYLVNDKPLEPEATQHYLGFHDSDSGGRISKMDKDIIHIIPLGKKYKFDQFPAIIDGKLKMEFEGKTYTLKENFTCNF